MTKLVLAGSPGAFALDSVRQVFANAAAHTRRGWRHAIDRLRRAARERKALRELHAMTDRQLADIGLSRGDLPRLTRRPPLVADDALAWDLALRAERLRVRT